MGLQTSTENVHSLVRGSHLVKMTVSGIRNRLIYCATFSLGKLFINVAAGHVMQPDGTGRVETMCKWTDLGWNLFSRGDRLVNTARSV